MRQHPRSKDSSLPPGESKGEPFIIATAGEPLVKVVPLDTPTPRPIKRLGFMAEPFQVPDDFDRMGADEIEWMFGDEQ